MESKGRIGPYCKTTILYYKLTKVHALAQAMTNMNSTNVVNVVDSSTTLSSNNCNNSKT
jgi:hypothetical protein